MAFLVVVTTWQPAQTQLIRSNPKQEQLNNIFLTAPRGLRQQLSRARKALDEERYGEAVDRLGQLLAAPELSADGPNVATEQDYFLAPGTEPGAQVSLKSEAQQLLGNMPPKGRELYELKYGADAQRLLDEALEQRDYQKLVEVTRRYFHTNAGYSATMLIGRQYLDRGRPLAAALTFQRLANARYALPQYDPELSVLLSTCWLFANMPERAEATLVALKNRAPDARLVVGGKEIELFENEASALAWLDIVIGSGFVTNAPEETEWTVHRGNASRNAETSADLPLLHARWRVRTANHPSDEEMIRQKQAEYRDRGVPATPVLYPLAVDDVILMRTPQRLIAVNFETGKRIWEFPWFDAPDEQALRNDRSRPRRNALNNRAIEVQQRVWDDAAYGQISSNGRDVFLLWELGTADPTTRSVIVRAQGIIGPDPNQPREHNKLVALSLEGEGKLRWIVGGEDGTDEPKLANAFFLGAPLPLMGRLYALAEVNGEIRLVVLDADTGRLEWAQQLAHVDSRKILVDPGRRLAGASPSFSNGVLICPTSAGAVVAVDVATRSLLWGYQYPQALNRSPVMVSPIRTSAKSIGDRWSDATVTIAEDAVLLTPVESDSLLCLDLLSGKPKWDPLPRNDLLFTAAVRGGQALMVAKDHVQCINLSDGKTAWKQSLPAGTPSGRGILSGRYYFLPTSAGRLLKIDINTGQLDKEIETNLVMGNLLAYRDQIVSQGVDWLSVYYQSEPLRRIVTEKLQKNPDDVWALARRAELELYDGQRSEALATLQAAFRLAPNDDSVRSLLVTSLLSALRDDFAQNQDSARQLEDLIDQPSQQMEYYRLMARGLQQLGEFDRALTFYIKLTEFEELASFRSVSGEDQLVRIDDTLRVRPDRWMQAQLAKMLLEADGDVRQRIDHTIQQHLDNVLQSTSLSSLRQYVDQFGAHPSADVAELELARQLIARQQLLDAESCLVDLRSSSRREIAGEATALLATMLMDAGKITAAAMCYRDLENRFGDLVCLDAKTGAQLASEARQTESVQLAMAGNIAWPAGKCEVNIVEGAPSRGFLSGTALYPIPKHGITGPLPKGTELLYDNRMNAILIRNALGETLQRVLLGDQNRFSTTSPMFSHVVAKGHLLLVSIGFEVVAIDMLGGSAGQDDIIWRRDLSSSSAVSRSGRRTLTHRALSRSWGPTHYILQESSRLPIGTMGPLTSAGVFCQKMRELSCLDPLTGETIWTRSDVEMGSEIFGDDEWLFVVPPDSTDAIVLHASDGTEAGRRPVYSQRERWFTHGRNVVACVGDGKQLQMRCFDAWQQAEVWNYSLDSESRCCQVGPDEVAVMDPTGKLRVIRLHDGSLAIDAQLKPEPELQQLYVQKSSAQYLVIASTLQANRPIGPTSTNVRLHNVLHAAHAPFIDGNVYAFDGRTGEAMWPEPAAIHKFCMPLDQPVESPVFVLLRHVSVTQTDAGTRRGAPTATMLCLDKRDGRELLSKDELPAIQTFEMIVRPQDALVIVALNSGNFTFKMTADPTDPQPPVQTKDPTVSLDSLGRKIAGAILDALGSAATEPKAAAEAPEAKAVPAQVAPAKAGQKADEAKEEPPEEAKEPRRDKPPTGEPGK